MKALEIKRENRFDSAMIMRQVLQTALGRVLERNEGDAREQTEAAEQARRAEQAKAENERRLQAEAEERRREAEAVALRLKQEAEAEEKRRHAEAEAEDRKLREAKAEEQRQRELMEQELRAAEEKRIKAEQAAEEARIREEAELAAAARAAEAARHAEPVPAAPAEVVAYRETSSNVEEEELAAVLKELEEAEAEAEAHARPASQAHEADVAVVYETPLDMAPEAAPMAVSSDDDEINDIFSVPEKTGFSLPMPAIAGMIGLVFVIAIGGYFAMSGSSDNAKQSAASVQVEQPQTVEPTPSPDAIVSSTDPQAETASVTESTGDQPAASAKATPKPKKADAKADPAKKKVTVDDLINDN
jgi:hypothetical protein